MEKQKFVILLASTVIAVFLGSFTASLIIYGNHRQPCPSMEGIQIPPVDFVNLVKQHQKMIEQQSEVFDKMQDDVEDLMEHTPKYASFGFMSNAGLNVQETKDMYKIIVDLKPFNDDMNNVDVKIKGHNVIISAHYKSKNKDDFHSSEVYQSLMLPSKIDIKSVKKQQEGNSLVVVIPKE